MDHNLEKVCFALFTETKFYSAGCCIKRRKEKKQDDDLRKQEKKVCVRSRFDILEELLVIKDNLRKPIFEWHTLVHRFGSFVLIVVAGARAVLSNLIHLVRFVSRFCLYSMQEFAFCVRIAEKQPYWFAAQDCIYVYCDVFVSVWQFMKSLAAALWRLVINTFLARFRISLAWVDTSVSDKPQVSKYLRHKYY